MKLKFDSSLDYQLEAINSVVELFTGIKTKTGQFTVSSVTNLINNGLGYSNQIISSDFDLILQENLNKVQKKNCLTETSISSHQKPYTFDIEMETGTGKTYVFLRTIYELNKNYGFNKFIIVVPSIAIKEGVLKTLDITKEHFRQLYNNEPLNYFIYDSNNMNDIREFSTSNEIQIMIINIQAFNSENKIFLQSREALSGEIPVNLIKQTNPIIIIDEPQTTASTKTSIESIEKLNPLFVLRYSATFRKRSKEHQIYRLDAIDAYNKNLVKQIEVYGSEIVNDYGAIGKVISTDCKKGTAKIECYTNKDVKKQFNVKEKDEIIDITHRSNHNGLIVDEIDFINNVVKFTNGAFIEKNSSNEVDDWSIKKTQITTTIKAHLDKQVKLKSKGIKVLSLFFLDEVKNYRQYDDEGNALNGKYANYFEEQFEKIVNSKEEYKQLYIGKDIKQLAKSIHQGYFSIDKKKRMVDSKTGESKEDVDTYSLIMKDKEQLLSFNEELAFIFSHSALREGWDNPNVFQVCTLCSTKSEIKKRQQIGRGLRICVNQNGERCTAQKYNKLSIIANSSYEQFADDLQKELKEAGLSIKKIDQNSFIGKINDSLSIDNEKSKEIYNELIAQNYISNGSATDEFYEAIMSKTFYLEKFSHEENQYIIDLLKSSREYIKLEKANAKVRNKLVKSVYLSEEFKELWQKISSRTTYKIKFDTQEFINQCIEYVNENMQSASWKIIETQKGNIQMQRNIGVVKGNATTVDSKIAERETIDSNIVKDIINELASIHELKKATIIKILCQSNLLKKLKVNPYQVKISLNNAINQVKKGMICNGIKYTPVNAYYEQSIIEDLEEEIYITDELTYKLPNENEKCPFEYIKCQSTIEKDFAEDSSLSDDVKKFIKLPRRFIINTPLGDYNPDWAILTQEKIVLIAETKGSEDDSQLRESEKLKIKCGQKHFDAINNIQLRKVTKLSKLIADYKETIENDK